MDQLNYILFSVMLIIWCIIHSFLISNKFLAQIKSRLGARFKFYRIFYNVFSLITFIPLFIYSEFNRGELILIWNGYLHIIQGVMLFTAVYLFISGGKDYDGLIFLGIRQLRISAHQKALTSSGDLKISGILGVIRHPWYSGAILLLWSRNLDMNQFIANIILTAYLIIGSYLEEKKLLNEFGEKYRTYQQQVSMLFPYKWLFSKITKKDIA